MNVFFTAERRGVKSNFKGMQEVLVMETMEDMDLDGNGEVDLEEYIKHIVPKDSDQEDLELTEWIQSERAQFSDYMDKNGDGQRSKYNHKINFIYFILYL